jgi:hypothetical protein
MVLIELNWGCEFWALDHEQKKKTKTKANNQNHPTPHKTQLGLLTLSCSGNHGDHLLFSASQLVFAG